MERGKRYAVCDKTFQLYRKAPYAECFEFIEPRVEVLATGSGVVPTSWANEGAAEKARTAAIAVMALPKCWILWVMPILPMVMARLIQPATTAFERAVSDQPSLVRAGIAPSGGPALIHFEPNSVSCSNGAMIVNK